MAKAPPQIRSLARGHTETAINVLVGIMNQTEAPPAARVQAATSLLDRGWGKPAQIHAGDEDGGPVQFEQIKRVIHDPRNPDSQSLPAAPDTGAV